MGFGFACVLTELPRSHFYPTAGDKVAYRGTSLMRKRSSLGPYRRLMPRTPRGVLGGWAFSGRRGTPVGV